MAPLPLLAAATGVTGSMFALEGSLLNAYLLSLAHKFKQERSDENARKVFRCSLWYLPVLLAGFVFHSRNWAAEGVEEDNVIAKMRRQLAKVCVHEVMIHDAQVKGGALCPAVVGEGVAEEAAAVLDQVKEATPDVVVVAGGAVRVTTGGRGSGDALPAPEG